MSLKQKLANINIRVLEQRRFLEKRTCSSIDYERNLFIHDPLYSVSAIESKPQETVKKVEPTIVKKPKAILLCAIAKMENNYLREWVEHYKNLGFDNICLYDNNDIDGEHFEDVIGDYIESGFVIVKDVRGFYRYQIQAYNECYKEYCNAYRWIAFFDIDEFLVLDEKYENNVKKFISDPIFSKFNTIRICWQNFDDNDLIQVENSNYNCVTRFTRERKGEQQSKVIVNTNIIDGGFMKDNPHVFSSTNIKCCNTIGKPCLNTNSKKGVLENAHLNHYRFKTIEEYVLGKMVRLWPTNYKNGGKSMLTLDYFFSQNNKSKEKEAYAKSLLSKINNKENQIVDQNLDERELTIAVVGNSPCGLEKNDGEEIDSHDIVVRFNNFQIEGEEKHLGKKTDMMAVVSVIRHYDKTDMFLNLPKEYRLFRDDRNPPDNAPIDVVFDKKVKEEDVIRLDEYIKLVKDRMPNYKENHYPSTGLVVMQYLCKRFPNAKIDAYAITFFKEKKIHVYDNKIGTYHDRNAEINYFNTYLKDRVVLHCDIGMETKKKIAIVGNSPCLMEQNYGEEIDSHDMVVRINHFDLNGYEKFLGTKTTDIYFHTKTLFSPTLLKLSKEHRFMFHTKETLTQIKQMLDETYKGKINLEDITLLDIKKYYYDLKRKINSPSHKHASTGLIAIQDIVNRYPNCIIDVYGITFFSDTQNGKMMHYDGTTYPMKHDNNAEVEYFNKFLSNKVNLK